MGISSERRERFLREHPFCAFCGGSEAATTDEHCPPKAMFQNCQWPEGFDFPACAACNNGSGRFDHVFALCARVDPFLDSGNADGRAELQLQAVVQMYPDLAQQVLMGPCEARRYNREHGIRPRPGQFQNETGIARFAPPFVEAVNVVSLKLTKALYYRQIKRIFPASGCVAGIFSTNSDLARTGSYPIIDHFMRLGGVSEPTRRSGKELSEQFQWKFTEIDDEGHFLVQATFGRAFIIMTVANPHEGRLEAVMQTIREQTPGSNPFKVLQGRDVC